MKAHNTKTYFIYFNSRQKETQQETTTTDWAYFSKKTFERHNFGSFVSSWEKKKDKMKDLEVKDPIPPTRRIHKLVLTGGPCGGKTTGQAHLAKFFESLGWKVFRVPETATVLMSGGISFGELNEEQVTFTELLTLTPYYFID